MFGDIETIHNENEVSCEYVGFEKNQFMYYSNLRIDVCLVIEVQVFTISVEVRLKTNGVIVVMWQDVGSTCDF